MKFSTFTFCCFYTVTVFAMTGKEIMTKVDKRNTGDDFQAKYKMTLINKLKTKERSLLWWRKKQGPKTFNLIKIVEPKNLKNTGILIYSNKQGDNQTWLFLSAAAKKEPRKIASNNKDSRFLGSEFYYVDFEENGVDEFSHKFVADVTVKTWSCWKVESVPKDKSYVYEKIVSYVDKSTNVVVKSELYRNSKLEKVFQVEALKEVQGIHTIASSTMDNKVKNRQTKLSLDLIKYNQGLKDDIFSQAQLTRDL